MSKKNNFIKINGELLGVISALAEAQNVSECDISAEDVKEFCHETGWSFPEGSFELRECTYE